MLTRVKTERMPERQDQHLISILMPFRDTAPFLTECLESIRVQEYRNWELLAVDDHSTDPSAQLIRGAAASDPRIRVFENPGKGIIPALREAYSRSNGQLITRMDSDDRMGPKRLRDMCAQLTGAGPGNIALGQVRYFSESGISDGYDRYEKWLNRLTARGDNFSEIYKECVIPSPCWMVWREDLERCGAFTPDDYPEDYDLTFRFYEAGLRCLPSEGLHLHWRDYPTRTSRNSEHYAQNYFLEIKTRYFLRLDREADRPLLVWGAGFKGKKIARILLEAGEPFRWVCDNPKKIGKRIYDKLLEHYGRLEELHRPQSIITVANGEAQSEIRYYLEQRGQVSMRDYFFFC